MIIYPLTLGPIDTNCYIVAAESPGPAALVDPADDAEEILGAARTLKLAIEMILLTHTHFDHILALEPLRRATGARIGVHPAEAGRLMDDETSKAAVSFGASYSPVEADFLIEDGDTIQAGGLTFHAFHTPGHSPGGLSFYTEDPSDGKRAVFTGDALFANTIGRTDLKGGDMETLLQSIRQKLYVLPDDTQVYPGHGWNSLIGREKRNNPFVRAID